MGVLSKITTKIRRRDINPPLVVSLKDSVLEDIIYRHPGEAERDISGGIEKKIREKAEGTGLSRQLQANTVKFLDSMEEDVRSYPGPQLGNDDFSLLLFQGSMDTLRLIRDLKAVMSEPQSALERVQHVSSRPEMLVLSAVQDRKGSLAETLWVLKALKDGVLPKPEAFSASVAELGQAEKTQEEKLFWNERLCARLAFCASSRCAMELKGLITGGSAGPEAFEATIRLLWKYQQNKFGSTKALGREVDRLIEPSELEMNSIGGQGQSSFNQTSYFLRSLKTLLEHSAQALH